ncbi:hypothetical protein ACFWYW_56510 [Nonomuraea sp. NPDC059023]|uniref:hypothetical protein n=1 Tax=unclassified Nonomuraea TaxID=2593643 RepID=UPI00368CECD9
MRVAPISTAGLLADAAPKRGEVATAGEPPVAGPGRYPRRDGPGASRASPHQAVLRVAPVSIAGLLADAALRAW